MTKRLNLGDVNVTRGVHDAHLTEKALPLLEQHATGNWGLLPAEDKALQDVAFAAREPDTGTMFMSVWFIDGQKIWIVTHYGYATTLLFPEEY